MDNMTIPQKVESINVHRQRVSVNPTLETRPNRNPENLAVIEEKEPILPDESVRVVTRIEPRPPWQLIDLRELWRYRELLFLLAWRDVSVRYKQSILGLGWALAQPVATMFVFAFFLGTLGGLGKNVENYALFVFAGTLPWTFFSNAVSSAGNSLLSNKNMLTKIYFPRMILPMSCIGSPLFDFFIACVLLSLMMIGYGVAPSWNIVFLPIFVIQLGITALGTGLFLSALIVAQRDFKFLLGFGIQLWMFATPTIYLSTESIGPKAQTWLPLNPAYGPILNFRSAILDLPMDWKASLISGLSGIVIFAIGLLYFRRTEKTFADIV